MNSKEKFLSVINLNKDATVPNWEFAYWYDTIQRWYEEGLPKGKPPTKLECSQWVSGEACPSPDFFYDELNFYDSDVCNYFGFDERAHSVAIISSPIPAFRKKIFSEDDKNIIFRREDGKIVKTKKDGSSMPNFIDYPVKDKKDFEKMKERFNPYSKNRIPNQWDELVEKYRSRTYPLQLGGGNFSGLFSILREMLGTEKTLYSFYDNPTLVFEMLEFFTEYYINLYSRVVSDVEVDYILIWEDLAFRNGPMVSPDIFSKFILPYYKKLTSSMNEFGIKHFFVDTDGNFEVLIPLFIEGGVTGFYPFEVQAGMDIEKVRENYFNLVIMGGIDKKVLTKDNIYILEELKKVKRLLEKGGYIPYADHMVPPDVSFSNYKFYREELKKIIDNYYN